MNEPTRVYKAAGVKVEWRPELCTHCQACITGLPEVFNLNPPPHTPWVNVNAVMPHLIREQVAQCPSGALRNAVDE